MISPADIPHPPDRETMPTPKRQRNTHRIYDYFTVTEKFVRTAVPQLVADYLYEK